MRLIKNTTELIGIKDPNIIISLVLETNTHIEIHAKLDHHSMPSLPWNDDQVRLSKIF